MKIQKNSVKDGGLEIIRRLSVNGGAKLRGKYFIPVLPNGKFSLSPLIPLYPGRSVDSLHRFRKVSLSNVDVVAIDSSIVPVAEAMDSFIVGVRGALTILRGGVERKIVVDGPRLFYLDEMIVKELLRFSVFKRVGIRSMIYNSPLLRRLVLTLYEYFLLMKGIKLVENGYVLVDGSLDPHVANPRVFREVLQLAEERSVSIIGLSKRSRLVKRHADILSHIYELGVDAAAPVDTSVDPVTTYVGFLRVRSAYPFRIDVFGDELKSLDIVYSLPSNSMGYPSLLVEAHTIAKLRTRDIVNLLKLLASKGGKLVMSQPYRSQLLGALEVSRDEGL